MPISYEPRASFALFMFSWWRCNRSSNCDASVWEIISDSRDIALIHGGIFAPGLVIENHLGLKIISMLISLYLRHICYHSPLLWRLFRWQWLSFIFQILYLKLKAPRDLSRSHRLFSMALFINNGDSESSIATENSPKTCLCSQLYIYWWPRICRHSDDLMILVYP